MPLSPGHPQSFDAFLLEMPDVGHDEDFERIRDTGRPVEL